METFHEPDLTSRKHVHSLDERLILANLESRFVRHSSVS